MRLTGTAAMLVGGALLSAAVCAQTSRIQPSLTLEEVLTDNVNLTSSNIAKSDLVTQLIPGLNISETGPRSSLVGFIQVPILVYARTGAENNRALPSASLLGSVQPIEKLLYVEGAALVQQQFLSPFGAQPVGLSNATGNRIRTDSYRVTPYIQSNNAGDIKYELRDDNIWTHVSGSPFEVNDAYTNRLTGNISRRPVPLGWTLEIERTSEKFYASNQSPLVTQLARGRIPWKVEPDLQIWASGGYEDNHYTFTNPQGAIYGGGAEWRPGPRTTVKGQWEHRFFGSSYLFSVDERTALAVFNVLASRDLTSYPQQLATIPAGVDVQSILNQLLLSRITDPDLRQTAVDQIIQSSGLPSSLTSPLTLYSDQLYVDELARATVGMLGSRNRVFLTAFRSRIQAIVGTGSAIPPPLGGNDTTQRAVNVIWTHMLTPVISLNTTAQLLSTVANAPFTGETRQGVLISVLASRLSPNLTVHAGLRYQVLHSDVTNDYREAAIFAGFSYVCCSGSSRRATSSDQSAGY